MQGSGRLPLLSLLVILLSTLSAAWPWPASPDNIEGLILRRQKSSSPDTAASSSGPITTSPTSTSGGSAQSNAAASGSSATSHPDSDSPKNSTSTTKHETKTTSIDPRLPPGGIEMVTPNPISGAQYYKVGDYFTFAWNYTSLSVTPTAVDVLASCATNNQYYTIALNQSVTGPTGAVTWDTGEYQSTATIPLLVASYTLVIYDAAKDITAIPSAGYLDTYAQFQFGVYTPQPYVPIAEFQCATCNGALSQYERQALSVLLLTSTITILSFTWFAGNFGIFS